MQLGQRRNTQLTAWSQELSFTVCEVGTAKINLKLQRRKKTTDALDELIRVTAYFVQCFAANREFEASFIKYYIRN